MEEKRSTEQGAVVAMATYMVMGNIFEYLIYCRGTFWTREWSWRCLEDAGDPEGVLTFCYVVQACVLASIPPCCLLDLLPLSGKAARP